VKKKKVLDKKMASWRKTLSNVLLLYTSAWVQISFFFTLASTWKPQRPYQHLVRNFHVIYILTRLSGRVLTGLLLSNGLSIVAYTCVAGMHLPSPCLASGIHVTVIIALMSLATLLYIWLLFTRLLKNMSGPG
jgi:hypothetical protein